MKSIILLSAALIAASTLKYAAAQQPVASAAFTNQQQQAARSLDLYNVESETAAAVNSAAVSAGKRKQSHKVPSPQHAAALSSRHSPLHSPVLNLNKILQPNKAPHSLWVETDLEPDDLLGLYAIHQQRKRIGALVCGEGDGRIKARRCVKYAELLQQSNPAAYRNTRIQVIQGADSKKTWDDDGREFDDSQHAAHQASLHDVATELTSDRLIDADYKQRLLEYIYSQANPMLVIMKPMRELLQLIDCSSEICETLRLAFRQVKVFLYGAFNLRTLYSSRFESAEQRHSLQQNVLKLFSLFKQVNIAESFHMLGQRNNINMHSTPIYSNVILQRKETEPFLSAAYRSLELWNQHLIQRQRDDIVDYQQQQTALQDKIKDLQHEIAALQSSSSTNTDHHSDLKLKQDELSQLQSKLQRLPDSIFRSQKVVDQISAGRPFQMVAADVVLASIMFDAKFQQRHYAPFTQPRFTPNSDYVVYDEVKKSNMRLYKNIVDYQVDSKGQFIDAGDKSLQPLEKQLLKVIRVKSHEEEQSKERQAETTTTATVQ